MWAVWMVAQKVVGTVEKWVDDWVVMRAENWAAYWVVKRVDLLAEM